MPSGDAFCKQLYFVPDDGGTKSVLRVPDNIDLRLMEREDESMLGGEHNGVFFNLEHLAVRLHFPVPAIVK